MAETIQKALRVLKFGGTSVGSPNRIRRVAKIIESHHKLGDKILVVVSAMGDSTDELIELAQKVSPAATQLSHLRELDMLLSTGERISMALVSMALNDLGLNAISLTGSQSGIITSAEFGVAKIQEIKPMRIERHLSEGKIVIVAGFQGVSTEKEITTLGRGGSDTSAVALAIQLRAKEVIIYTDVDGIFNVDPRRVKVAKRIDVISWELALEAAARGAQVLDPRCVELAWKNKMPIRVASSFLDDPQFAYAKLSGTLVTEGDQIMLESSKVLNISIQNSLCSVVLSGMEKLDFVETFLSQMTHKGLFPKKWKLRDQALHILFDLKQREALTGQKIIEEYSPLTRISILGVGLTRDPAIVNKIGKCIEGCGLKVIEFNQSASVMDFIFESCSVEVENKIIETLNSDLMI